MSDELTDDNTFTFEEWNKGREIVFSEDSDMDRANAIAVALSEARRKAQEPFLAVAALCEQAAATRGINSERELAFQMAAKKIRRAAEENGE